MGLDEPEQFIVSKKPKEFLKQGLVHCGAYSVKAILEAYDRADKKRPEEYYPTWWQKVLGFTSPRTWEKVLKKYGLKVEVGNANGLSPEEKVKLLKNIISKNAPIMLRIGNGYLLNGRYNPVIGRIISHWITIWGYNDARKIFYVYDSAVSPRLYDKDIPVGNKIRTCEEMIRDWRGGLFPWPFWRFMYIKISDI